MKGKKFALLMILPMLVSFARAGSYVIEDDIYYNPDAKNPIVEQKEKEKAAEQQARQVRQTVSQDTLPVAQQAPVQKTLVMTTDKNFFDVDEYNRRGSSSSGMTIEEVAANQTEPNVEYNIVDENGDDGYYLNGFNGSQWDYEYALRIRRFHNPKFAISIGDPFYSDIYFLDNNDWNVYISDDYAWVTPTWTNPWYWDYMWSPYSYTSWSWRWNLGPWGFSFGYDPLYRWGGYWGGYWRGYWGGYWGWSAWHRPYFHHHFYSPYYHRPYYSWNRPQYTPNGRRPNRYGGSVVSSGSSSSVNGRRATIGTTSASNVSGRRVGSSAVSSSNGSSTVNGVRTNRGTVISNSTNSNSNRGYSFGSANTSRRGTTSSGSVSLPSSSQSRRQTTINRTTTPSRNSYNNSVGTSGRRGSSSYNRGTTSSGRSSGFSRGSSSSRRSSSSYSAPSSSSRGSSGSISRGSSGGGRGGRR